MDRSPTPATTDVYNLKVQVEPEDGFPVMALDAPVAELSPLARHFPAFAPEAGKPVVDGDGVGAAATSTPPLAGPGVNEKAQHKGLAPVSLAEEAAKSEEMFLDSAAGKPATPDAADFRTTASPPTLPVSSVVDKPPSSVGKETSGGDRCGVADEGMADTAATFGVGNMSEMMATEEMVNPSPKAGAATAPHRSPAAEAAPASTVRGARPSESPGWKGYAIVGDDADAPPPEGAPQTSGTTGEASAAEANAAEDSLYAVSPPESKNTMNVCSPNQQDCVIS